jgi:N-acetylglucosaminyl-diphospho-decaprenol L-rhamnosyltransferase
MTSESRIPIVIVSYRNPEDVVECLEALQGSAAEPAFDVHVCENGGPVAFDSLISALTKVDGPCAGAVPLKIPSELMPCFLRVQYLRFRGRDARVLVAEAGENFGYAGGVNAWLRVLLHHSSWPGVWILNPDTQPDPRALAELVVCSTARRKGMVGSRIVSFEEPSEVRGRGLRWQPIKASTLAVVYQAQIGVEPDLDQIEAVLDAPSGASMYVTRHALETVGLMDEQYFLYFEDLDWGVRAKKSCGVGHAHKSIVRHRGGTTIGSSRLRSQTSPFSVYLEFRNRVRFVRRNRPMWLTWTLFVLCGRTLEFGVIGAWVNMRAAHAGLRAGLAGETGRPDRLFEFRAARPSLRRSAKGIVDPDHQIESS